MNSQKNILNEAEVLEILQKTLKADFQLRNHAIKPASDNPKGFLGEHYLFLADVSTNGQTKHMSYFIKKTPEIPQHLHYVQNTKAFYKEVELYKTAFVDLKNAQEDIPKPTKWRPEYYYSRGSDLIVLEDLSHEGYYMYPERCYMDEEHLVASLRVLAAMHAASFVFEEKFNTGRITTLAGFKPTHRTVTIGDIYAHLTFETEVTDVKGHPGNNFHEAAIGGPVKIVEYLDGYSEKEKRVIQEQLPGVMRRYYDLVKASERYRNVFVHGDLWANNILFRKDETGINAVIIDFQLVRFAPPAHDVIMFLHFVQGKQYLQERKHYLLQCYHSALSEEMSKNSLRVDSILPWGDFLDSCDFYEDLGLISKLFFFQLILAPEEVTSEFLSSPELFAKNFLTDRTEMVVECFLQDEICRSRMTEALNDAIKRFILPCQV